jgi:maltose O-acetyltransferase
MRELVADLLRKVRRDRELGLVSLAANSARYAAELATAPLWLRKVDHVGARPRTFHKPRIVNRGHMTLGDDVQLRSVNVPVELVTGRDGRLSIGDRAVLNYGVSIDAAQEVSLGARVLVGPYVMIIDSDFHDLHHRDKRPDPRPVRIGDDVWLGAKASVLRGVTIGRGAVVAVGAVVNKDVEPFTIVAGVPAKLVGHVDEDHFVAEGT